VFVPHLGCPHDCVFCNQKKITGQSEVFDSQKILSYIDSYLETMKGRRYPIEIAFYGGSFTGIDTEDQIEYLKIARRYLNDGHIHGIRLSTRPDYINDEILKRLKLYKVNTIELGVQSLSENVLTASNRGHSINDVENAVALIREYGFNLGLQMMIGLPEDTLETAISTAQKIVALRPAFVRIYPTVVIKDTELEIMYNRGLYKAMDINTAIEWLVEIMPIFSKANIPVIRVGLQPTDDLSNGESRVAGAYHPSIRQLVKSEAYARAVIKELSEAEYRVRMNSKVVLSASDHDWTAFKGIKGKNFARIEESIDDLKIEFEIDKSLDRNTVGVAIIFAEQENKSDIYKKLKID